MLGPIRSLRPPSLGPCDHLGRCWAGLPRLAL